MRYLFSRDSNALVITLAEGRQYRDSEEVAEGIVIDFDVEGRPYAIEFLQADRFVDVEGLVNDRPVRLTPKPIQDPIELTPTGLKNWREHLGLSQEELASQLAVPADVVRAWENGDQPVQNAGILRLAMKAIEGNAHEEYLRQALREVTETLQGYLAVTAP